MTTIDKSEEFTLHDLHNLTEHEDIMNGLERLLPKWVDYIVDNYAPEYSELTKAWDQLCEKIKTTRSKILIVQYLPMASTTDNDRYINTIADILVSKGYLIRRRAELIVCSKTGLALLSEKMYNHFKRHNAFLPAEWSDTSLMVSSENK